MYYSDILRDYGERKIKELLNIIDPSCRAYLNDNEFGVDLYFTNKDGEIKTIEVKARTNSECQIHYTNGYYADFWIILHINKDDIYKSNFAIFTQKEINSFLPINYITGSTEIEITIPNKFFINFDDFIESVITKIEINKKSVPDFNAIFYDLKSELKKLSKIPEGTKIGKIGELYVNSKLSSQFTDISVSDNKKYDFIDMKNNKNIEVKSFLNFHRNEFYTHDTNSKHADYFFVFKFKSDDSTIPEMFCIRKGKDMKHTIPKKCFRPFISDDDFLNEYNKMI
jgi:hypothetical protein